MPNFYVAPKEVLAGLTPDEITEALAGLPAGVLVKALTTMGMTSGLQYPAQAQGVRGEAEFATSVPVGRAMEAKPITLADVPGNIKGPAASAYVDAYNAAVNAGATDAQAHSQALADVAKAFTQHDGEWIQKGLMVPDEGATMLVVRQLRTDGYKDASDILESQGVSYATIDRAMQLVPEPYAEVYRDRLTRTLVSKSEDETAEGFQVEVAFKALLPEQQITYGVVYPAYDHSKGERDLQKDWAQPHVIEKAAHNFMAKYRQQDTFHNEQAGAGEPVESYIAPCDLHEFHGVKLDQPIRKGSWIMATKWNDETWKQVKIGKIRGYSIGGFKTVAKPKGR